ncbi:hypothetical protein LDENG_00263080 [Lucifuga dentata]|nr:hypothetical protein LDENG_00263080 [Lucifuga dentata]
MDHLVDNLIEDEAEREKLIAKPTCFIIVGRPGVGKSTLAKKIAESWRCILIDDTDLLNTHIKNQTKQGTELLEILSEGRSVPEDMVLQLILARINSPDIEHYGYVLSCLPFLSEDCLKVDEQIELIRNLKLTPDFIINIKCADKDLIQRLSGLRQHQETGQFYLREWKKPEEMDNKMKDIKDEDQVDEEEEQVGGEEPQKNITGPMLWTPENLSENASLRINMYKDTMLRPLEDYMADHDPLRLIELDGNNTLEELHWNDDDEELPDEIDTGELMRSMCSSRVVVPGFRWRRSRWGRTCPVALKEGMIIQGKPKYSVGFQDKVYILSSQEAYQKFVTNPRPYLLPPMPKPPCKVSIIGPPQSGKSTLCKLLAQHYRAQVLDIEELMQPVLAKHEQDRLDKIKEETTQITIEKIKMTSDTDGANDVVTEDHPEVKAMVLNALEAAKHTITTPSDLYAEVLEKHLKEIHTEDDRDAEVATGWVLDNFPKNLSQMDVLQQAGILPVIVFCLKDTDGSHVLKRLYEMNKESVDEAVLKRLQEEQLEREKQAMLYLKEQEAKPAELQANLETVEEGNDENPEEFDTDNCVHPDIIKEEAVVLPVEWELGYPDGPEMNEYKQQLNQFVVEGEHMVSSLTIRHSILEIGGKSPKDLLQEMIHQMEKPFQYMSWELSGVDLQEEEEDNEASQELEKAEEGSSAREAAEEEESEEDTTSKRLLGDTHHFCPVALKDHDVLLPCTDEIAAKYREKMYYFSSTEARECFLQKPEQFVTQTEPLKPPALRIFLLGARGSGKTTQGKWLAQQLGLFHIQFRELLQELIMAKTKSLVIRADEVEPPEEPPEGLEALIKEASEDDEKKEDATVNMNYMEQEVALTYDEEAIKAYLSRGASLPQSILDIIISPYWKQEPYKCTGFILEGFPCNADEVMYMVQRQLFPDVVVIMEVGVMDVQKRILPSYLDNWSKRCNRRKAQLKLLHDLRGKIRVSN